MVRLNREFRWVGSLILSRVEGSSGVGPTFANLSRSHSSNQPPSTVIPRPREESKAFALRINPRPKRCTISIGPSKLPNSGPIILTK